MFKMIVSGLVFILCTTGLAYSHPSDGYDPRDVHPQYGSDKYGISPDWDINDLYFVRPLPDLDSLTEAEKYVLAGTSSSALGYGLAPWYQEIFTLVCIYEAKTGRVPSEMNMQTLDVIFEDSELSQSMLEVVTSPISGQLPRLNREYNYPGDCFIRKLTENEMYHFASLNPRWNMIWFEGIEPLPEGGSVPVKMLSDVYYMRVYGENSEIMTRILFNWR